MHGRVVIPIHHEHGELVAYAGRWPGDEGWPEGDGKYKLPPNFKKSHVVYNLHRVGELAEAQGLILVEGFFGCMRVWQSGSDNVVALMGSALSEEQEHLIVDAVGPQGRVMLLFDADDAGRACCDEALGRLSRHVYVKVIDLPDGMQPDRLDEQEIRRLLA